MSWERLVDYGWWAVLIALMVLALTYFVVTAVLGR